ncbi:MAG: hypothetical protein K6E19_07045 [Lachnospiraceae bacterium]|nr:hypothetical protein [Lachnospiraceae bacterium]
MKKYYLALLFVITALLSACAGKETAKTDRRILIKNGVISYITEDDNVFLSGCDGTSGILAGSEDAKSIYGDVRVTILLKKDNSVRIFSNDDHQLIDSE